MAYFQAKIGWKRLRKRENKNYHSVSFQLRSEERRVGMKWNDNFYFFSFPAFSNLFWLEIKP